jgi:hypothetical protein
MRPVQPSKNEDTCFTCSVPTLLKPGWISTAAPVILEGHMDISVEGEAAILSSANDQGGIEKAVPSNY